MKTIKVMKDGRPATHAELCKAAGIPEHTPGPWEEVKFFSGTLGEETFVMSRNKSVALMMEHKKTVPYGIPKEEAAANAALIAAAPEMLEALQVLVKWMDDSGLSHTEPAAIGTMLQTEPVEYSVVTDARNAIAKATGAE